MKWFLLTKYLKHRKLWGLYFRFAWNKNKVNLYKKATKKLHSLKKEHFTAPSQLFDCQMMSGVDFMNS